MRLYSTGSDHYLDHELSRVIKNAIGSQKPLAGNRANLLEEAAQLGPERQSEPGIVSRIMSLLKTLQHQRWMTGDYEFGQDIKHSYLAGMAHISVA